MKTMICNCRSCRRGRKASRPQAYIKARQGGTRRQVKMMLAKGEWEALPLKVWVGYVS